MITNWWECVGFFSPGCISAQYWQQCYNLCKYSCKLCANIHHSQGQARIRITYDRAHAWPFHIHDTACTCGKVRIHLSTNLIVVHRPISSLIYTMCNLIPLTSLKLIVSGGRLIYWLFQQQPHFSVKVWHTARRRLCLSSGAGYSFPSSQVTSRQRRGTPTFFSDTHKQ